MKKARGWRGAGLWPSVSGGSFQKRGLSWPALYRSAVAGLPFLIDIRGRAISHRGVAPCFDRYQKWSDRVVMGWRCWVGLPCVCNDPVEIRSIGVDQQEFDAAGFGVGTAAGGLFRFAHDDAFGRDAFGDEGITNAKGALFGQVSVEGGITGGVVVAGQQDVAALGGVEGFDDGSDDGCVFRGDVGRCRGEVDDARDFGGAFDIEGDEIVFVVGAGSGG